MAAKLIFTEFALGVALILAIGAVAFGCLYLFGA